MLTFSLHCLPPIACTSEDFRTYSHSARFIDHGVSDASQECIEE